MRIVVSRGRGPRGYSPKGSGEPTCVMSSHEVPSADPGNCRMATSSYRVNSDDPLTEHKTCNKLLQVLARAEAEETGADEALLVNRTGEAVTASGANIFWISRQIVCTPPISAGALPGITRGVVAELCEQSGLRFQECMICARELSSTEGVFITLSSKGIVPITKLDGAKMALPEQIKFLQSAYGKLLAQECRGSGN